MYISQMGLLILPTYMHSYLVGLGIGYSMFCVGYGIYTRERSSRVYIS